MDLVPKYKRYKDFENSTNISLRNRYVYFAVDKVANSTIKNAFFEIEYLPVKKPVLTLRDKRASPLLSPYQLGMPLLKEVLNSGNYFRFAFVRNPYSRLLSCYLDRILDTRSSPRKQLDAYLEKSGFATNNIAFTDFVRAACNQESPRQNSHWRAQTDDILLDHVDFDFIGKFENLWNDLADISRSIWGSVPAQMSNESVNKSPSVTGADSKLGEFYTPELVDMVATRYKEDFERFGYSFDLPVEVAAESS